MSFTIMKNCIVPCSNYRWKEKIYKICLPFTNFQLALHTADLNSFFSILVFFLVFFGGSISLQNRTKWKKHHQNMFPLAFSCKHCIFIETYLKIKYQKTSFPKVSFLMLVISFNENSLAFHVMLELWDTWKQNWEICKHFSTSQKESQALRYLRTARSPVHNEKWIIFEKGAWHWCHWNMTYLFDMP